MPCRTVYVSDCGVSVWVWGFSVGALRWRRGGGLGPCGTGAVLFRGRCPFSVNSHLSFPLGEINPRCVSLEMVLLAVLGEAP